LIPAGKDGGGDQRRFARQWYSIPSAAISAAMAP
jgi:hypothetical protein